MSTDTEPGPMAERLTRIATTAMAAADAIRRLMPLNDQPWLYAPVANRYDLTAHCLGCLADLEQALYPHRHLFDDDCQELIAESFGPMLPGGVEVGKLLEVIAWHHNKILQRYGVGVSLSIRDVVPGPGIIRQPFSSFCWWVPRPIPRLDPRRLDRLEEAGRRLAGLLATPDVAAAIARLDADGPIAVWDATLQAVLELTDSHLAAMPPAGYLGIRFLPGEVVSRVGKAASAEVPGLHLTLLQYLEQAREGGRTWREVQHHLSVDSEKAVVCYVSRLRKFIEGLGLGVAPARLGSNYHLHDLDSPSPRTARASRRRTDSRSDERSPTPRDYTASGGH